MRENPAIDEVILMRRRAEDVIGQAIEQFTKATRLKIKAVRLEAISTGTYDNPDQFVYSVRLEVSL